MADCTPSAACKQAHDPAALTVREALKHDGFGGQQPPRQSPTHLCHQPLRSATSDSRCAGGADSMRSSSSATRISRALLRAGGCAGPARRCRYSRNTEERNQEQHPVRHGLRLDDSWAWARRRPAPAAPWPTCRARPPGSAGPGMSCRLPGTVARCTARPRSGPRRTTPPWCRTRAGIASTNEPSLRAERLRNRGSARCVHPVQHHALRCQRRAVRADHAAAHRDVLRLHNIRGQHRGRDGQCHRDDTPESRFSWVESSEVFGVHAAQVFPQLLRREARGSVRRRALAGFLHAGRASA
jgi:hypothetical protein